MISSFVKEHNGISTLFVNGRPFPASAYMTYLEEYNDYPLFAASGYNLYSVPVLFAGRWISVRNSMKPFHPGIFDNKDEPDFSSFEHSVSLILESCPYALIIPRVNMSMPLWWIEENPACLDGTGDRELLGSEKWKNDAGRFLEIFLNYLINSKYAGSIAGLHLAGGNTEEWFYFDLAGGCCENAMPAFKNYLENNYPDCKYNGVPDLSLLDNDSVCLHGNDYLRYFLEFSNAAVADSIMYFASVAKKVTDGALAVGVFYGYSLEVPSPLYGTHALKKILRCGDIDFICSPNSYIGCRDDACDWTEMFPADSVRLHGKMCLQECDIRTHLTKLLYEKDSSLDPDRNYTGQIWKGPLTKEASLGCIRKAFCRQLIKGNGLWWFDMWGGWFADGDIMSEMQRCKEIYARSLDLGKRKTLAEFAVFTDESAYSFMTDCSLRNAAYNQRKALGMMGAPYDVYDVSDFEETAGKYKAVLFISPDITREMKTAVGICREKNIPYLAVSAQKMEFTAGELRDFCEENGVTVYCGTGDILYYGENHVAIHALNGGRKEIRLGSVKKICRLLPEEKEEGVSDTIRLTLKKGETVLFGTD